MIARLVAGLCAVVVLAAVVVADDLPSHIIALARAQHAIADELRRLTDYTCTETIERFTAESGGSPFKAKDNIVVEVAKTGKGELYAWPGQSFEERSVIEMVGDGFISDGDFSTMLHNVFVGSGAQVSYAGPEPDAGGRRLLRYNFHIPVMSSGWHMSSLGRTGTMGSLGSFWLDADTLELVRMRYEAEDMPAWSVDQWLEEDVAYAPVVIGDSRLLLPSSALITALDFSGRRLRNRLTFANCRKFSSESTISFTDSGITFDETLSGQLDHAIDTSRAAVGDEVTATLTGGGKLRGRIVSLGRRNVAIDRRSVVIQWTRAEYPDRIEALHADPTNLPLAGRRAVIPAGVAITLRTLPVKIP